MSQYATDNLEIWVNLETKRIMAVNRNCKPDNTVWISKGYKLYNKFEEWMKPKENPPYIEDAPESIRIKGDDEKIYELKIRSGQIEVKEKPKELII